MWVCAGQMFGVRGHGWVGKTWARSTFRFHFAIVIPTMGEGPDKSRFSVFVQGRLVFFSRVMDELRRPMGYAPFCVHRSWVFGVIIWVGRSSSSRVVIRVVVGLVVRGQSEVLVSCMVALKRSVSLAATSCLGGGPAGGSLYSRGGSGLPGLQSSWSSPPASGRISIRSTSRSIPVYGLVTIASCHGTLPAVEL